MNTFNVADRVRYTREYRFLGTSGGTVLAVIAGTAGTKVRVAWDSGSTTVNFTYELRAIA